MAKMEDDLNETKSPDQLKGADAKWKDRWGKRRKLSGANIEVKERGFAGTLMRARDASTPDRLSKFSDSVSHVLRKLNRLDWKFIEAAEKRDLASARELIAQGADVNAKDEDGATPLIIVARNNDTEFAAVLIAKNAAVDANDDYGVNALMETAYEGGTSIARMLLSNGADVGARDFFGETALMKAAFSGNIEMAELLIANGAKVNIRNHDGGTALKTAFSLGHIELAAVLRKHGGTERVP